MRVHVLEHAITGEVRLFNETVARADLPTGALRNLGLARITLLDAHGVELEGHAIRSEEATDGKQA